MYTIHKMMHIDKAIEHWNYVNILYIRSIIYFKNSNMYTFMYIELGASIHDNFMDKC